ncbi:hypothetical protein PENTCL1PPCAC_17451, partial [Pristionchus entomophagus]
YKLINNNLSSNKTIKMVPILIEETEAHVIVGLLLDLLLLLALLFSGRCGGSRGGRSSRGCSSSRDGDESLGSLGDELGNGLSGEAGDHELQLLGVGVDSDGAEDALDVGGGGGSISSKDSKHIRGDVTHLAE